MEDNELIERCKNGDKSAFQELLSKYNLYIYKYLLKISKDSFLAEDLKQEVLIKIINNIKKFDIAGKGKFSSYIITISKNCYLDYLKKHKQFMYEVSIEDNIIGERIEDTIINNIYLREVVRSLNKLPENQKIVISMKYLQGFTIKEISEILNVETGTIKSRIHNGICKLRRCFKDESIA
ncbi:sigma-70 family RNA polymerase sigma factor [Clostridium sp.]|jgi:RNA polymerase sigma-70 factor (ECF subfamily)|uniref:RNA polymerase sigma factor n=1 Tax=Clostridium sp. TaxID=1506 RepID=UPI00258FD613|nr:sigma-70 family RNA polymerase sigma factor [Clostridium sp.]MDF2503128.1 polymerase subunit sigma-24 [Clostridium sp.]